MGGLREETRAPSSLRSRLAMALDEEDRRNGDVQAAARKRRHAKGFAVAGAALAGFVLATSKHGPTPDGMGVAGATMVPPVFQDVAAWHARELPPEDKLWETICRYVLSNHVWRTPELPPDTIVVYDLSPEELGMLTQRLGGGWQRRH